MDFSPAAIVRRYFLEDWAGVMHKQGDILALEINYTMDIGTCKYCFE